MASASCRPTSARPDRGPRRLRRPHRPPPGPAAGGAGSLPAGISRAVGAGWERPPAPGGECDEHSITGQFFDKKGGVAPSPDPDPDIHRSPSTIATERTGIVLTGTRISTNIRGVRLLAYERGSGSGPVEVEASQADVRVVQAVCEVDGVPVNPGRGPMEPRAEPCLDFVRLLPAEPSYSGRSLRHKLTGGTRVEDHWIHGKIDLRGSFEELFQLPCAFRRWVRLCQGRHNCQACLVVGATSVATVPTVLMAGAVA